jgi:hypothetical protein
MHVAVIAIVLAIPAAPSRVAKRNLIVAPSRRPGAMALFEM